MGNPGTSVTNLTGDTHDEHLSVAGMAQLTYRECRRSTRSCTITCCSPWTALRTLITGSRARLQDPAGRRCVQDGIDLAGGYLFRRESSRRNSRTTALAGPGVGSLLKLKSVRRDPHEAGETCVVHAQEVCFSLADAHQNPYTPTVGRFDSVVILLP